MSQEMQGVVQMMKTMGAGMFSGENLDVPRIREMLAMAYAEHQVEEGVSVELTELGGVEAAIYTPDAADGAGATGGAGVADAASGADDAAAPTVVNRVVYYVHGGGLVTGDRLTAGPYASQLALACGCPVVSCSYRLAPEDPFPAGLDDTLAVYQAILDRWPHARVCVTGESGGAHLSLALALACKQRGIAMPAGLVLDSVVADMTGELIEHVDTPTELVVSVAGLAQLADMYAPGDLRRDPLCSNILGDYAGLPPMRVVYDAGEMLAPDSLAVAARARKAGVPVEIEAYEGCFHAFTTTGKATPESARELELAAAFMSRCFDRAE